jgi:hypothetical protein
MQVSPVQLLLLLDRRAALSEQLLLLRLSLCIFISCLYCADAQQQTLRTTRGPSSPDAYMY